MKQGNMYMLSIAFDWLFILGNIKVRNNFNIYNSVSDWHRPLADKNWKWPILSELSGQNGLSKLGNPAQMADHFYGTYSGHDLSFYMF